MKELAIVVMALLCVSIIGVLVCNFSNFRLNRWCIVCWFANGASSELRKK